MLISAGSKIRIVTAKANHLKEILSLDRDAFKEADWFTSRQWRYLLRSSHAITLLAYRRKEFAGSATGFLTKLRNGDIKGRIYSIAVPKSQQRGGVGGQLLKNIEATLIKKGASFITLETRAHSGKKRFFEKRGYVFKEKLPKYYEDEDGIRMVKLVRMQESSKRR